MHWDYVLILGVLGVAVPWRSTVRVRELLGQPALASSERVLLYASTILFQWTLTAVILWRCYVHGTSRLALGFAFPEPLRALWISAGLSIALVFNQIYGIRRLISFPPEKRGLIWRLAEKLLPREPREAILAVFLAATVAICEEIIFRGFVETIFQRVLHDSVVAGAIVSAAFFAVAHLYQGKRGLITTFIVGIVFSAVRIFSDSLVPCIIVHFIVDISAGIVVARGMGISMWAGSSVS
ncbi:MAG TPA: CPBP family intramembrane glutamic endopeptidase [Candidatus Acidoferrales bacterium]|nr:CPBP family intramembrane glutamic endopeptidase [Candidatus Acidoferrales bacterium]